MKYPTHYAHERNGESIFVPIPDDNLVSHLLSWMTENKEKSKPNLVSSNKWCPNNSFFEFVPEYRAVIVCGFSLQL